MDTQKKEVAASGNVYAELTRQKTVVGAKQLKKAMANGNALRVYLAKNADPAITEPLEALCKAHTVGYTWVKSMTDLGRACGIEVDAAAAAVVR